MDLSAVGDCGISGLYSCFASTRDDPKVLILV